MEEGLSQGDGRGRQVGAGGRREGAAPSAEKDSQEEGGRMHRRHLGLILTASLHRQPQPTFPVLPTPFFKSHSSQDSSSHLPLPAHCWGWHWSPGPPGFQRCLQAPALTCQAGNC